MICQHPHCQVVISDYSGTRVCDDHLHTTGCNCRSCRAATLPVVTGKLKNGETSTEHLNLRTYYPDAPKPKRPKSDRELFEELARPLSAKVQPQSRATRY